MPTCALCLRSVPLLESHLMPKALYKYLRDETAQNPNPIIVSPTKAVATSKQYRDDLLCAECEDRFNKNGEGWVLKNCWRSETEFALQVALLARPPLFSTPDITAFAVAGDPAVDVDKLAYFAASILWRAGVNDWSPVNGHTPNRLTLGPYQEQLRQYDDVCVSNRQPHEAFWRLPATCRGLARITRAIRRFAR